MLSRFEPESIPGRPTADSRVAGSVHGLEVRRVSGALNRTEYILKDDRFHLFVLESGSANALGSDDKGSDYRLSGPAVCWMPGGFGRSILQAAGSSGALVSVPDTLLEHSVAHGGAGALVRRAIEQTRYFESIDSVQFKTLHHHVASIERELYADSPGKDVIVHSSLAVVLIILWRLTGADLVRPSALPRNVVHTFTSLLDMHLRDHWSVGNYADAIGITRDRLNTILRRSTGKSTKELIHAQMIMEAKLLLTSTSQQVAQIAFTLGYSDPGYFNRFFVRMVGETPARYRTAATKSTISTSESFAAWP